MQLRDYINKIFGKLPNKEELEQDIEDLSRSLATAQKGVFESPMYKTMPFDTESEQGIVYIKNIERLRNEAQERLEFFYPPAHVVESNNVPTQPHDTLQRPRQEPL